MTGRQRALAITVAVLGLLVLGACATVFLVLTGIIAEPETLLENFVRWLQGS